MCVFGDAYPIHRNACKHIQWIYMCVFGDACVFLYVACVHLDRRRVCIWRCMCVFPDACVYLEDVKWDIWKFTVRHSQMHL